MTPERRFRRVFRLAQRTPDGTREEIDEEIHFHIEQRVDQLMRRGLTLDQALAEAKTPVRRRLGRQLRRGAPPPAPVGDTPGGTCGTPHSTRRRCPGRPLRAPRHTQATRPHRCCRPDAGARSRREHGDVQRRQRCALASPPVRERRARRYGLEPVDELAEDVAVGTGGRRLRAATGGIRRLRRVRLYRGQPPPEGYLARGRRAPHERLRAALAPGSSLRRSRWRSSRSPERR
jgi:hypothetical protein